MTRALLLLLTLLAAPAHARTYLCGSEDEIQAALADINAEGKGGTIAILPGEYQLKAPYRQALEENVDTAPIPEPGDNASKYALYVTSPNVTIKADTPGSVKLLGQRDPILNPNTTRRAMSAFRGGMIFLETTADNATLAGLDIDGGVPVQEQFNKNAVCQLSNEGWGCWDWTNKAVYSHSPSARILDCKVHHWAGEMIYAGNQSLKKLEIRGCEIYGNQVSALSGTWQLKCHDNEFHDLHGQVMEGLHNFSCQYHDNYFHDCTGGGLNILGPVAGFYRDGKWWVDVRDNLFERMSSPTFGCVYLSQQTTPDVEPPSRVAVVGNTFRDCRTVLSVSLGPVSQVHFENNLVLVDTIDACDGVISKSGSFDQSLFRGNTFTATAEAVARGVGSDGKLRAGWLDTGKHEGTCFTGNLYRHFVPPKDATGGYKATQLRFVGEIYEHLHHPSIPQKTRDGNPTDALIPTGFLSDPMSTGVYALKFNAPMHLRLATENETGGPLYQDGTELRLIGMGNGSGTNANAIAYLLDGRGCQLKGNEPAFLASRDDYVLLRYSAPLKLWHEAERATLHANRLLRLSHRGPAADLPRFDAVTPMIVDGVNVIDAALYGWRYFATDTGDEWIYTATGWMTTN